MNRIKQQNKEDFISFLKEVLDLFKWLSSKMETK